MKKPQAVIKFLEAVDVYNQRVENNQMRRLKDIHEAYTKLARAFLSDEARYFDIEVLVEGRRVHIKPVNLYTALLFNGEYYPGTLLEIYQESDVQFVSDEGRYKYSVEGVIFYPTLKASGMCLTIQLPE